MVPADDLAVPHKEDLDNAVIPLPAHPDDVPVLLVIGCDLLPVLYRLDGPDQIPHLHGGFEVQIVGGTAHFQRKLL